MTRLMRLSMAILALMLLSCETEAPQIVHVTALDNTTSTIGPYEVVAVILDAGQVNRAELIWRVRGGEWTPVPMRRLDRDSWVQSIPGQPVGTTIEYEVAALDNDSEIARFPPEAQVLSFEVVAPLP